MKNPSHRRKDGFTLVELLVVITIIAVLAGAGFAAGNAAIQKAKKTTALATAISLESAVNNFFTEYGAMPKESLSTDETVRTDDPELLNVLLGTESSASPLNTRKIKFLNVKEGKRKGTKGLGGIIYNAGGSTVQGLYDPWGGPYFVMLDGDYDEVIKPKPAAGKETTLNGRRVAAWTNGADAAPNGTGGSVGDDVITWSK